MIRILVLDDDEAFLANLKRLLEGEDYLVEVATTPDKAKGLMSEKDVAVAILDANLLPSAEIAKIKLKQEAAGEQVYVPEEGAGFLVASWIREYHPETGIIVLTSEKIDPESRIRGFECGSDDYIIKSSITNEEFLGRVRALLRRTGNAPLEKFRHWKFVLIPEARRIETSDNKHLDLSESQARLLKHFFKNPYITFDRNKLSLAAYGEAQADARSIDNLISKTRKQIEVTLGIELPLQTIRGQGYELK